MPYLPISKSHMNNNLLVVAILALTTWRITSLLVYEDGPKDIFARFRYLIGVRYDDRSEAYGDNQFAKAFTCLWCLSPYVGAILVVLWLLWAGIIYLYLPLALSAAAIMIEGFFVVRE